MSLLFLQSQEQARVTGMHTTLRAIWQAYGGGLCFSASNQLQSKNFSLRSTECIAAVESLV